MSKSWHMMEIEEVLNELSTEEHGLSNEEAAKRLSEYGLNELKKEILQYITERRAVTRGDVHRSFIERYYIHYGKPEYNRVVRELLKEGKILAEGITGEKSKLNDMTRFSARES